MKLKLLIGLVFTCGVFAQGVTTSGTATSGTQTSKFSFTLTPTTALVVTGTCTQNAPFFSDPGQITGTNWSCTATSNKAPSAGGQINITLTFTPVGTTVLPAGSPIVTPATPSIPAGATTTAFTLQF